MSDEYENAVCTCDNTIESCVVCDESKRNPPSAQDILEKVRELELYHRVPCDPSMSANVLSNYNWERYNLSDIRTAIEKLYTDASLMREKIEFIKKWNTTVVRNEDRQEVSKAVIQDCDEVLSQVQSYPPLP